MLKITLEMTGFERTKLAAPFALTGAVFVPPGMPRTHADPAAADTACSVNERTMVPMCAATRIGIVRQ